MIKNRFGFSLMEVMIAMGVAGMLSVVIMKLLENSQKQINMIDFKLAANEFHGELFLRFNGKACLETLKDFQIEPRNINTNPYSFDKLLSETGIAIFQKGSSYQNQFTLEGFRLRNYMADNPNPPEDCSGCIWTEKGYGNLEFILKSKKPVLGPDTIVRDVRIAYYYKKLMSTYKGLVSCNAITVSGSTSIFQTTCMESGGRFLNGNRCRYDDPSIKKMNKNYRILGNSIAVTSTASQMIQVSSKNASAFCQDVLGSDTYALSYYEALEGGENREYLGTNAKDMSFRLFSVQSYGIDIPLIKMVVCAQ